MKARMVDEGMIGAGVAPSYFIEGLLYNAPKNLFGTSYEDSFVNTFKRVVEGNNKNRDRLPHPQDLTITHNVFLILIPIETSIHKAMGKRFFFLLAMFF